MTLRLLMTVTASTQRLPAIISNKRGDPVTHLENVKITPIQLPSADGQHRLQKALGSDAGVILFECYTEPHSHTDNSVIVNQLPDIHSGDRLIVGSDTYVIRFSEAQPATLSTQSMRHLVLVEDN